MNTTRFALVSALGYSPAMSISAAPQSSGTAAQTSSEQLKEASKCTKESGGCKREMGKSAGKMKSQLAKVTVRFPFESGIPRSYLGFGLLVPFLCPTTRNNRPHR